MKKSLILLLLFCYILSGFSLLGQENFKIKILKSLFPKLEIGSYNSEKFISTIARNKFAFIPLSNGQLKVVELGNGMFALAFNIFLAKEKSDYKNMLEAELYNFMDISKKDPLWRLTDNERLIQVIIFDVSKNKFIATADNFPIDNLKWRPTGMGDLMQYESLSDLVRISKNYNSFYITIDVCPDCQRTYYFFNPEPNKLVSSEKFSGCFENIRIENNSIVASEITNCYEASYNDENPRYEKVTLLNLSD